MRPARGPATGAAPASLGARAARGTSVTLGVQGVRALLQVVSVVLLARLLDPSDFGLVAMVTSVIGIADLVRDFGLSSAAITAKDLSRAQQNALFWIGTALGAACTGIAVLAAPAIAAGYGQPRLTTVVLALAGVFTLSGASTQMRADLARSLRFGALGAVDVGAQASGIALAVVGALSGWGLWALVAQQVCVAVVGLVAVAALSTFRPGLPRRGADVRPFLGFGGAVLGTQSIAYATKNVDNVALGAVWGAGPLGLYTRAYQLLMAPLNQINAPMTRVALPVLTRVHGTPDYARYLARAQLVACYATATVFAVAAALSVPVVAVLFGPRWVSVAPIFAVLAVGGVFRALAQIAYWIFLSAGRPGAQLRLSLVTGPATVALILAGLPWGAIGVAAGHSVAHLLVWIAQLVVAGRSTGTDVRPLFATSVRALAVVALPCAAAAGSANLLPWPPLAQVAAGVLAAAAAAALVAAVVPRVRADAKVGLALLGRAVRRAG